MHEIFVQGSCDAVLMAWPIMDAETKQKPDPFSSKCCIAGIPLDQLSFVDDLLELTKTVDDTNEKSLSNEIFERKSRLNFKTSKCKVLPMNTKEKVDFYLDGAIMEKVDNHVYLGTIVSKNGERVMDMQDRITKSASVANEIVQICKETELSDIRLRYVKQLISSCLDGKVKYGCPLWDILRSKKALGDLNKMKPSLIKRVLQLPSSTPSDAILYEFGIVDLSFDILMEKIILAVNVLNMDEDRVVKKLLIEMLSKNVKGFCTELKEACEILNVSLDDHIADCDVRKKLKDKLVEIQKVELYKRMVVSSKMDNILLNGFKFDGKVSPYLLELDFYQARAVFMMRFRMMPTKCNFPGRWNGLFCDVCNFQDSDAHLFTCPGFQDLIPAEVCYDMFWDESVLKDAVRLKKAACVLLLVIDRLEVIQGSFV